MRTLVLAADYLEFQLRDSGDNSDARTELSSSMSNDLDAWNEKYQVLIPMSMLERESRRELINDLDAEGLELANRIEMALPRSCKVIYYSEGKLGYLR